MHNFLERRRAMLGIYVNKEGITLCQTSAHKGIMSIDKIVHAEGSFATEEVGPEVYKLLKKHDFNTNRANLGISNGNLIKSYLELPYMSPRHALKYIEYELQRLYRIDPTLYNWWSYTLSVKPHSDYYRQRVVTFGVSKHFMKSYETQFAHIGLKINSFILPLDAHIIILENICDNLVGEQDVICYIYIELSNIDVCFYRGKEIISMSTVSMVGRHINHLQDELKIIFNYFHMENYGVDVDIVILSGDCHGEERYLTLFAKLGYRAIWLSNEMLGVRCELDSEALPFASYVNAIGPSMYY